MWDHYLCENGCSHTSMDLKLLIFIMANIMPMKVGKQINDEIFAVLLYEQPLVILTYYLWFLGIKTISVLSVETAKST